MAHLSKAKRVRNYMVKNADAGPSEVAAALSKHGVTAAYVSNIKSAMKKETGRSKPQLGKRHDTSIDHLKAASTFIKACGSLDRAKDVLKATSDIVDLLKSEAP